MSTDVTPDAFLAALTKWGVKWRFYKDRADWLSHNRNEVHLRRTPGGFGPLRGVVMHNTASTAQAGMIDYLYRGDKARELPGPLAHGGILKTGEVVLLGWGTTNHAGPGDPVPDRLVRDDAMPLTREHRPTVGSLDDPNAIVYAPYYIGFEPCYADEGPTDAQRDAMVRATCASLDAMGGPTNGYGAGSVVMHRELTTRRSDPQGWPRDGSFRRAVAAMLKAGPTGTGQEEDIMASIEDLERTLRKVISDTVGPVVWAHPIAYRMGGDTLEAPAGTHVSQANIKSGDARAAARDALVAVTGLPDAEDLAQLIRDADANADADAIIDALASRITPRG